MTTTLTAVESPRGEDGPGGLRVWRRWWTHPSLLDHMRRIAVYPPGDRRATGYLHIPGDQPWPEGIDKLGDTIRGELARLTGQWFDVVAFQGYRDGSGCTWHDDANFGAQAILSLGVARTFGVRPKPAGEPVWLSVADGDLVYMPPDFSDGWEHCVPEEDAPGERISLVFRTLKEN